MEYYGDKERRKNELDRKVITEELGVLLRALEEEYHTKPIIYTTYSAYHDFIDGAFNEYGLWIRNVYYTPGIGMKGRWLYWQYTDRAKYDAYTGEEPYRYIALLRCMHQISPDPYTASKASVPSCQFLAYNRHF